MQRRFVPVARTLLSCLICAASFQAYAEGSVGQSPAVSAANQTALNQPGGAADTVLMPGALNETDLSVSSPADTQDLPMDVMPASQADPYEGFNRIMFDFNDHVDILILKPIATVYNKIMPKPLNQGVHNFFLNIGNLPTIANDILQFNFHQAANDIWRTIINTTIGIGGLFDVGSRIGLMPYSNDFGLTLAAWGFKDSYYLVVPFWGPSTIRDTLGWPVDYYAFSVYPRIHPAWQRYSLYGLSVVDRRAQLLQFQSVLEEAALDQYTFIRNAYLQRRAYQMEQNKHRSYADLQQEDAGAEPVADQPGTEAEAVDQQDNNQAGAQPASDQADSGSAAAA